MKLDKIAEQQIKQAQSRGELDGLEGEGKPLPPRNHSGDSIESIGFRIMAGAGAIPEEIKLRKAIETQLATLKTITEPLERKAAMKKLSQLQMKLAIQEEARRSFSRR